MDWFKGKFTGKPHISWENLWFPVDFPLNQSIEASTVESNGNEDRGFYVAAEKLKTVVARTTGRAVFTTRFPRRIQWKRRPSTVFLKQKLKDDKIMTNSFLKRLPSGSSLVIRYFSNLQYLNLLLPSGNLLHNYGKIHHF
jgi:hypothetical protein